MVLGYLLSMAPSNPLADKRLSSEFSAFQLFKGTIEFLATHDFEAHPIFMTPDGKPIYGDEDFSAEAFSKRFDTVIVDPSGQLNLAARVTAANLMEIQYEARLSLSFLSDPTKDQFDAVFLKNVYPYHLRFDHFVRIPVEQLSLPAYSLAAKVDYPSDRVFALHYIPKVFKRGLNKRIKLLSMTCQPLGSWSVTCLPPNDVDSELYIGLVLDIENSFKDVEQGPAFEDNAALERFRRIWGEKSEMRRFKDGSISESVVFEADGTFDDRAMVTQKMTRFLIKRHMGVNVEEGIQYYSGPFISMIKAPGIDLTFKTFQGVNDAFAELCKQLKSLNDLPLSVTSVLPSHPGLYFSSVFVPQPVPDDLAFSSGYRPYAEPLDIVLEFETSGHWPDNLAKLQQMKRAFYLKIAKSMNESFPGTIAQVNIGEENNVMASGWVDITTLSGFKFRCRIHSEREKYLLEQKIEANTPDAKKRYQRDFVICPSHALKMYNLCIKYHFLPSTVRLVKRWIGSHLLGCHIPDQTIETLCVYIFSESSPWSIPGSSWVGFTRFLCLLSGFDWISEPMLVEMEAGKLTEDLRVIIKANFKASEKKSWFIATEDDLTGVRWTNPDSVILNRLRSLAKSCVNLIESETMKASKKWTKKLFTTPLADYDAIIRLNPQKCSRFRENLWYDPAYLPQITPKYRNLISSKDRELALISKIDTVACYLTELVASLGDVGWFFVDPYGGDAVAVVWKVRGAQFKWKVDTKFNFYQQDVDDTDYKKNVRLAMNCHAILGEIERIGNGLVIAIEVFAK